MKAEGTYRYVGALGVQPALVDQSVPKYDGVFDIAICGAVVVSYFPRPVPLLPIQHPNYVPPALSVRLWWFGINDFGSDGLATETNDTTE
jgi:hypothetical protein